MLRRIVISAVGFSAISWMIPPALLYHVDIADALEVYDHALPEVKLPPAPESVDGLQPHVRGMCLDGVTHSVNVCQRDSDMLRLYFEPRWSVWEDITRHWLALAIVFTFDMLLPDLVPLPYTPPASGVAPTNAEGWTLYVVDLPWKPLIRSGARSVIEAS